MGKKARNKSSKTTTRPEQRTASAQRAAGPARTSGVLPPALARSRPAPSVPVAVKTRPETGPAETGGRTGQGRAAAVGCMDGLAAEVLPHGVAATYWFEAADSGDPYTALIRFTGMRTDATGRPGPGDRFDVIERLEIIPGSGRTALTTKVPGVNPGTWRVTARPDTAMGRGSAASRDLPRRVVDVVARPGVLGQGPGVRLLSWPLLVGLGAVVALVLQALLVGRSGYGVMGMLAVSLIGCALGFAGAKAWYLALHRRHPRTFMTAGACIQGFLLVALGVVALGAGVVGIPIGKLLDLTTPGIFLGMAIGRPGCFLTGCCAGRPTSSRWGLWSSDRRLGVRRLPVQLVEAAVALAIGIVTLTLVLGVEPGVDGMIFTGAVAAYTFARQVLFPLRNDSRTATGRAVTMAACGLVLAAATILAAA
ncbi:prolipoprotein diacylglyceryl transferase family protein [Amycolatopsis sp. NPDC057786]|uniref:prolipoprotein diacylglyceryl transferase family protein n=1 Tax=Amycolatopsis sp. NPDC057786 TaxID=3346250 RepID=UPI0036707A78